MTIRARAASVVGRLRETLTWQQWLLLLIAAVCAFVVRDALFPDFTKDFTDYEYLWLQTLRVEGFRAFGTDFANYNPPYLYLLYLGSLTPLSDLAIVKLISDVFDVILAAGVGAITYRIRRSFPTAAIVGLATFFVPEVFLNSGMWGQADVTYTAFLVWAAYFLVSKRPTLAWICFAIAFEFKLQGLFFLPLMAIAFIIQRHRLWSVIAGVIAAALTCVPSLIAGRSAGDLMIVYFDQVSSQNLLTANAANMYAWIPNKFFATVNPAGEAFALAIVCLLCALYLQRAKLVVVPELWLLQIGAAIGVLVPFVLPDMHDRYFYAGDLFAFVCLMLDRRYLVPVLTLQFTAVMAYSVYLFDHAPAIPLAVTAVLQLGAVAWIVWLSLTNIRQTVEPFFPPVAIA